MPQSDSPEPPEPPEPPIAAEKRHGYASGSVTRAVFIDRDNTLMANDGDLGDPALVALLPGVGEAISLLRRARYRLVVVTNQGGVARGRYGEIDVHAVHRRLEALLRAEADVDRAIDLYLFCPFHPAGSVDHYRREHPWRKPAPGMIEAAAAALTIDLRESWMVGDAPRDIDAGRSAGCRTILVGANAAAAGPGPGPGLEPGPRPGLGPGLGAGLGSGMGSDSDADSEDHCGAILHCADLREAAQTIIASPPASIAP